MSGKGGKGGEKDPLEIYNINYRTYVLTGFWINNADTKWKKRLFTVYKRTLAVLYVITVVAFFIDAIMVRHDLDKLSFNMTSSVLMFVTMTKTAMLFRQRVSMESVLKSLDNHLNMGEPSGEHRDILVRRAIFIQNITKLLYVLLVVCYVLRVMADTAFGTKAYLIPLPYLDRLDDYYEYVYAQQVISISHFLVLVISHDMIIYGIINRFIAHYEILQNRFQSIRRFYLRKTYDVYTDVCGEDNGKMVGVGLMKETHKAPEYKFFILEPTYKYNSINEKNVEMRVKQELRDSIRHHQKLLKEVIAFSKIYSQPLIVQACGAVLLIGIVAIKILFISNRLTPLLVQQVIYIGITLINILFLCSFGTLLTTKSRAAAYALYDTPWYEMNVKNKRIVHFAMTKFMAVPKLRGGGWIAINRVTYLKFLQTSYNMVIVLRNLY